MDRNLTPEQDRVELSSLQNLLHGVEVALSQFTEATENLSGALIEGSIETAVIIYASQLTNYLSAPHSTPPSPIGDALLAKIADPSYETRPGRREIV